MPKFLLLLFLISATASGQMSIDSARKIVKPYYISSYSYHQPFIGKKGYGAPVILTADGGAAVYGDSGDSTGNFGLLVRIGKDGKELWKQKIKAQFTEIESQSVAEDSKENLFVFLLSYDEKRYRGGTQRVLCYSKNGKLIWDKTIGNYTLINSPTISYIKSLSDGRIYLRGHVVADKPIAGKDPVYRYWEGWLDATGRYTQKTGDPIDWKDTKWMKLFGPEEY